MAKRVVLSPKLETAGAAALRDEILPAEGDLVLDGSGVEHLGALALEVLLSAVALHAQAGHAVSLEQASDRMVENLGRFGLTPETLVEVRA
jgi:chemotaxis protein CheX